LGIFFCNFLFFLFCIPIKLAWFAGLLRLPRLPQFMDLVCFFFNWTWLFYNLFCSYIVQKIVLEKKMLLKLNEVTRIKESKGNYCSPNIHCIMDYNSKPRCLAFFLFYFWIFVMIFLNLFLSISSFKINIVTNLAS